MDDHGVRFTDELVAPGLVFGPNAPDMTFWHWILRRLRSVRRTEGLSATISPKPGPEIARKFEREVNRYIERAQELRGLCATMNAHPPVHQVEDWLDETSDYLHEHFEESYVQQLIQACGSEAPSPTELGRERLRLLNWLETRCAVLQRARREFEPKTAV